MRAGDRTAPALAALAERLVQQALSTDPGVRAELGALEGTAVCLVLKGLEREVFLLPDREHGLRIALTTEVPVGVRIAGTPLALAALARGGASTGAGVEVSGDLALSQRLQRALARLELDWEELLARRMGDLAARRVAGGARALAGWSSRARRALEQDLSEYARYEAGLLPTREEVTDYLEEVDRLRMAVDRLEQRLARLARARRGG